MSSIEHLSYSSIGSYMSCSRAWRYHYVDHLGSPSSIDQAFGTAAHRTVERYLYVKATAGLPEPYDFRFWWNIAWREQSKEVAFMEYGALQAYNQDGADIFEDTEVLEALDKLHVLDRGKPMIEASVELVVPGVDIPIIGFVDWINTDGVPCDLKTANKPWTLDKLIDDDQQALIYLEALEQLGMPSPNWEFRHLILLKKRRAGRLQELTWKYDRAKIPRLFETIREVWAGIQAGVFIRNGEGTWKCSPKWCTFWDECHK